VSSLIATSSSAIVALSKDEALLSALMATMLEQAAIVTSSSIERFIDRLAANNARVALIDAASAPAPVGSFTQRLRKQFPQLLIVLTGSSSLQTELSAQIAAGTIFRFAPKPAAAQRLKIFLNAALHRSRQEPARLAAAQTPSSYAGAESPALRTASVPRTAGWLQRLWGHS
jgi:DNA-binding NtrC family response regulator